MAPGDLAMIDEPTPPIVTDPDNVPEVPCDGPFNVTVTGSFVTLTFTHGRPDATALLRDGTVEFKTTVRARIVTSLNNLVALRDLLNRIIQNPSIPTPPAGGTKH
jgi:hypothetical protein